MGIRTAGLSRLRRFSLLVSLAAMVAFVMLATTASADVTPTLTTSLTNPTLGAHSNLVVDLNFDYDDEDLMEDADDENDINTEDIRSIVVDTPAGLVGNPNAIPWAERCDLADFYTDVPPAGVSKGVNKCPTSSVVGSIKIDMRTTFRFPSSTSTLEVGGAPGDVYLIKTDPEVPATLGIYVRPILTLSPVTTLIQIAPDANGDFHLRTTLQTNIPRAVHHDTKFDVQEGLLRIDRMLMTFFGELPNGNGFMTNPTRCEPWSSVSYASAWDRNANADSSPLGGPPTFKQSNVSTIMPDCSTAPAFDASGSATVNTNKRGESPDLDVTIKQNGLFQPGRSNAVAKKIVTTLPPSINVDTQQLGRLCANENFATGTCPASTRVGVVDVQTPLIAAGLRGYVYLLNGATSVLPDLGLDIRGAVNFRQRGVNHYVGPRGNQIQTTFDNTPQVGFSSLTLKIFGGSNGLLRSVSCPDSTKAPDVGDFGFSISSYAGQTVSGASALTFSDCFGVAKLKKISRCVRSKLKVSPSYSSRSSLMKSELWIKVKTRKRGKIVRKYKRVKRVRSGAYRFNVKISSKKYKRGTYRYKVRATYKPTAANPKPVTLQRYSKFKKC